MIFLQEGVIFQVSCSYGPGRYDPNYELRCNDHPIGYVRWTEQRNFVAVLQVLANSNFNTRDLITHTFDFGQLLPLMNYFSNNPYLGISPLSASYHHSQKSTSLNDTAIYSNFFQ